MIGRADVAHSTLAGTPPRLHRDKLAGEAKRRLEMGLRVAVGLLFGVMIAVMVIRAYLTGSK